MLRPMRSSTLRSFASLALVPIALACYVTSAAAPTDAARPTPLEQAIAAYEQGRLDDARRAFERLAQMGVPAADYNLAVMHIRGERPDASMHEALRLMTRAAERGFVTAMVGLGQLHESGSAGSRRDLAAAHHWYLRAAQAGSVRGQVEAATGFYLGRGTPKDLAAAAHWYREAARQGDEGAQYLIASMYEHGLGVGRDLRVARYWYEACARSGDVAARGKLREIEALLPQGSPD